MTQTAAEIWRKYQIQFVPASGPNEPDKTQIVEWGTLMENLRVGGAGLGYATRAMLFADLARDVNTLAIVYADTTAAYNGMYQKSGATGLGSWTRISDSPRGIVRLTVIGGTANAIVATSIETPTVPGDKLYLLTPTAANTGATTVNGAAVKNALGSSLAANSLLVDIPVLMAWQTDHYQILVSVPVDATGVLNDAIAARDAASGYATAAASSASALGNQVHQYDTRALAIAATIPVGVVAIKITRFATGYPLSYATYIPGTNTGPMAFQEAGGHWWQLDISGDKLDALWFGVNPASSNNTAAFNLALAAQGSYDNPPAGHAPNFLAGLCVWDLKTIILPQGVCLVTPGGLSTIYGSIYGPQTSIMAADATNSPLLTVNYRDNGAQTSSKSITLWGLFGYDLASSPPFTSKAGTAIMVQCADNCDFNIKFIRGFNIGYYGNGGDNNLHQGGNTLRFSTIGQCGVGIKLNAGDNTPAGPHYGSFQEINRIYADYIFDCTTAAVYLGGGVTPSAGAEPRIVDNIFEISSIFPNIGDGIVCTTEAMRNKFTVRSWDGGPVGAAKCIRSVGAVNLFRVPWTDLSFYDLQGTDIIDTATDSIGLSSSGLAGEARSNLTGPAPPTTGRWRQGDKMWNNAPVSGGPPGWFCTASGTPGTWKAMANLA